MIDFKEIARANIGSGNQDCFELFARDFLNTIGYIIVSEPSRGPDGGKDLIVKEIRKGISGLATEIFWLVSCKHYAHSGQSITPKIEQNINDRLISNNCDGFIAFYSTLPSEGLTYIFSKKTYQIYDYKKIEKMIVGNKKLESIFLRYFPISYKRWKNLNLPYNPIKLFEFYLNEKHEYEIELLKEIFLSIDNLFVALTYSQNFEEFVMFKETKFFEIEDLLKELDKFYVKIKHKTFFSAKEACQLFLDDFLYKRGYKTEKVTYAVFDRDLIAFNSTNTLVVNRHKKEDLIELYRELKSMI